MFLKERVMGRNQSDYLIKEAHAGGDDQNVMMLSKSGRLFTGTRMTNGVREEIEIMMPDQGEVELKQKTFGQWTRDRDLAKGGDLLYLNSSCWSMTNVASEIFASRASTLIDVGSTTTNHTLSTTKKNNVMQAIVHGVRNEKTFEQIRSDAKRNSGFANGREDAYMFPDEAQYADFIGSSLPLEIEYKVTKTSVKK